MIEWKIAMETIQSLIQLWDDLAKMNEVKSLQTEPRLLRKPLSCKPIKKRELREPKSSTVSVLSVPGDGEWFHREERKEKPHRRSFLLTINIISPQNNTNFSAASASKNNNC